MFHTMYQLGKKGFVFLRMIRHFLIEYATKIYILHLKDYAPRTAASFSFFFSFFLAEGNLSQQTEVEIGIMSTNRKKIVSKRYG